MEALISLNDLLPAQGADPSNVAIFTKDGKQLRTNALKIVPYPDKVDVALLELVCACMSPDINVRPTLASLLNTALAAVRQRTAAFYNNDPFEQDDAISSLWRDLTMTAPHS